jgi:rod shape-determining protein MreC
MLEFLRRNQVLLGSGVFLSLSFALLVVNRGGARRFDPLGAVFLEVLRPLQSVTTQATAELEGIWTHYVGLLGVESENRRLRERLRALEAEHHRDAEVELENRRLSQLLDFKSDLPSRVVTARVIGKDASGIFQTFTLDRGERDGVKPAMAVVSADGVIGRIAQSSPHASRVLVLSDHNSGVDALVQRTRARGIVEGTLSGSCSMKYIKRGDDVQPGDVVVTSGLDGIFPKGILVGRVRSVSQKDVGLYQAADVVPAVDFAKLEEVLVLASPPEQVNEAIEAAERAKATPEPTATALPTLMPTPLPAKPAATQRRAESTREAVPAATRIPSSPAPRVQAPP